MDTLELPLATIPDIVAELRTRPNAKWILFFHDGDDWAVSGNAETDMREAAMVLSFYLHQVTCYLNEK